MNAVPPYELGESTPEGNRFDVKLSDGREVSAYINGLPVAEDVNPDRRTPSEGFEIQEVIDANTFESIEVTDAIRRQLLAVYGDYNKKQAKIQNKPSLSH